LNGRGGKTGPKALEKVFTKKKRGPKSYVILGKPPVGNSLTRKGPRS